MNKQKKQIEHMIKNHLTKAYFIVFLILVIWGCKSEKADSLKDFRIAFMADVHFQEIYGGFSDIDSTICINPNNNKAVTMRTMQAQLNSSRLFNENNFAFIAALDDIVTRGVKYVILPGDFTDNGQPMNVKGVKRILDEYSSKYGLKFLMTTGNHDPSRPYTTDGGHDDFMGKGGKPQAVMSKAGMFVSNNENELPVQISSDVKNLGYREIVNSLSDYGFFPKKEYLFWETPFNTLNPENYNFQDAVENSDLEKRMFEINPNAMKVPDVSYLVEPVKGLWLLAIDANVYVPNDEVSVENEDGTNYSGSTIGYNQLVEYKKYLLPWVKTVAERAEKYGKILVAFSHYPMVEYYDDSSWEIEQLFGPKGMQMHRMPSEHVSELFADAGVKIHFGGHMHLNDSGIRKTPKGNSLLNIQISSLAAYPSAYKLLTIRNNTLMEVETIRIDSVPRFSELFDLYRVEHNFLEQSKDKNIWNKDILNAKNYHEYVSWHLKELVRLRSFREDWPEDLFYLLSNSTGADLLVLTQLDDVELNQFIKNLSLGKSNNFFEKWPDIMQRVQQIVVDNNLSIGQFEKWSGFDLVYDFYRLKNGDELAFRDIGEDRLKQYRLLTELFQIRKNEVFENQKSPNEVNIIQKMGLLFKVIDNFTKAVASNHFEYDLKSGGIRNLVGVD